MTARLFSNRERDLAAELFERVDVLTSGPAGGVHRPSYGEGETTALRVIANTARNLGLLATNDDAANLVISNDLQLAGPLTMVGSHLDAVPRGGNYDGLAGVVAALLVVKKAKDLRLSLPVVGYGLRGEESAWFGVPYIGAKALVGKLSAADLWGRTRDGVALGTYMDREHVVIDRISRGERILPPVKEFWELHIEQGPVLVETDCPVGVVSAIRGNIRAPDARVLGEAGHSGTTPHPTRKDAVLRFAKLFVECEGERERLHAEGADVVVTCGIVGTNPAKHSMTTIADEVRFSLDVRSTDPAIARALMDHAKRCGGDFVDWGDVVTTLGMTVDRELVVRAELAVRDLGVPHRIMPSGAGHDATVFQAAGIPAGMVFVRNRNGSHNPLEAMDIEDFMIGVEVLFRTIASSG